MDVFEGKVAVVLGAATGIGSGIARAIAMRGGTVEIGDIDVDGAEMLVGELSRLGACAHATRVDVTNLEELAAFAAAVRARARRIDYLFANAGAIVLKPFADTTPGDWQWLLGVNLFGCVNTLQAFLPGLLGQAEPSRLIVTASINVLRTPPMAGQTIYMASKAAQAALCRGLENDLRDTNVSISTIYPGFVATRIKEKSAVNHEGSIQLAVPEGMERKPGLTPEAAGDLIADQVARGCRHIFTHPEERDLIVENQAEILEGLDSLVSQ